MLKKSVYGIWLIFPKWDITGKYLTGCTASTYATNMHHIRFSNVLLLPLRNFNRFNQLHGMGDSNEIQTHNHLVCILVWTLNHLAKLAKWLSFVVSTYLYGAFDFMLLSCHLWVSEWINTL